MPAQARYTLLIVDDDEGNRDMLRQRLDRKGYHILEAASGIEAIDAVETEPVDLVLLDVMMPEMDGIEALRILRRTHPPLDLPIIMVTALADSEDVVRALESGANDYVTKPVDFAITLARIENQLLNRRALQAVRVPTTRAAPVQATAPPPPPQPQVIAPGIVIDGRYRLETVLGTGGYGTVYRARHTRLDHDVAIKFLQGLAAPDPDARERFRREGVSACRLQHPNAVLVLDYGVAGDAPFLVMEMLVGESLSDELYRCGYMSAERAIEIAQPVATVLAAAHRVGIIHRDIKPANVFLHRSPVGEVVKVLDFGIAKLVDDPYATVDGAVAGTPIYMAPERFAGVSTEGSLDVYSLGAMMYEMLAGRPPSLPPSRDPFAIADIKRREDPPDLSDAAPQAPAALTQVVMRSLARDPSVRPSAAEMERDLSTQLAALRAG